MSEIFGARQRVIHEIDRGHRSEQRIQATGPAIAPIASNELASDRLSDYPAGNRSDKVL